MAYITHWSKDDQGGVNIEIVGSDRRIGIFFSENVEDCGWCYIEKTSPDKELIMESGDFSVEMLKELQPIIAMALSRYEASKVYVSE